MKNSIAILLTGILIFLAAETMAQKINNLVEFGKIDKRDLAMTAYEADTSTSAVILFDYAVNKLTFAYTSFARHRRIKIFKKDG